MAIGVRVARLVALAGVFGFAWVLGFSVTVRSPIAHMPDSEIRRLAVFLEQLTQPGTRMERIHQALDRNVAWVDRVGLSRRAAGVGAALLGLGSHGVQLDDHAKAHPVIVQGLNLIAGAGLGTIGVQGPVRR